MISYGLTEGLSRHQVWVFGISGALIAANFVCVYRLAPALRQDGQTCPPDAPDACVTADRLGRARRLGLTFQSRGRCSVAL